MIKIKVLYEFTSADRFIILRHLKAYYEGTCELCGEASEEAAEAKVLYQKVRASPLDGCQKDIAGFYVELIDAVGGRVEECYQSDPSLVEMINKLCGGDPHVE